MIKKYNFLKITVTFTSQQAAAINSTGVEYPRAKFGPKSDVREHRK